MQKTLKLVKETVKAIVTNPDSVSLETKQDEGGILLTITVADEDMGLIIGKQGSTISALRTVAKCVCASEKCHISIKVHDPREKKSFVSDNTSTSNPLDFEL